MSLTENQSLVDVIGDSTEAPLHEKSSTSVRWFEQDQTEDFVSKVTLKTFLCVVLNIFATVTVVFMNKL